MGNFMHILLCTITLYRDDSMNINLIYIKLRKHTNCGIKTKWWRTYTILVNSDKPIDEYNVKVYFIWDRSYIKWRYVQSGTHWFNWAYGSCKAIWRCRGYQLYTTSYEVNYAIQYNNSEKGEKAHENGEGQRFQRLSR